MKHKNLLITGLIILTALVINLSDYNISQACPLDSYSTTIVSIKQHQLNAEIANTETARQCGLAFRKELPVNSGMLFVFEQPQLLDFWMKDTLIPITVAYINKEKIILEMHHMLPEQTDKSFPSKKKALYALEASPEWFSENKIHIGDKLRFNLE